MIRLEFGITNVVIRQLAKPIAKHSKQIKIMHYGKDEKNYLLDFYYLARIRNAINRNSSGIQGEDGRGFHRKFGLSCLFSNDTRSLENFGGYSIASS